MSVDTQIFIPLAIAILLQQRFKPLINMKTQQFSQLTLFPSGYIINAFILRFESVGCDDVLRFD